MAGTWTRNFYNLLTAMAFHDVSGDSSTPPTSYTPPIRVRLANGDYHVPLSIISTMSNYGTENDLGYNTSRLYALGPAYPLVLGRSGLNILTSESKSAGVSPLSITFVGLSSNSTPATYEDYTMTSLLSGLTISSTRGIENGNTYDDDTHIFGSSRTFTITNPTSSPVTVSSIGLYIYPYTASSTNYPCLLYREVFDNPIVLNQGESILLTITRQGEVYNFTPYPA